MNLRGEHRATADQSSRARVPRTASLLLVLAVGATAATWAEVHFAGAGQAVQSVTTSSTSQDNLPREDDGSAVPAGNISSLRVDDVLPAQASELATATSPGGYKAERYQGHAGNDCTQAFTLSAPATATGGCSGFLTADYVSDDHSLYSSVTVFFYPDRATAARAAAALNSASVAQAVDFQQPGDGLPQLAGQGSAAIPAATTGGVQGTAPVQSQQSFQSQVEAVGSAVDVIQTGYATGVTPAPNALATPTWYLAYLVGSRLAWE